MIQVSSKKLILICVAGLVLNLIGYVFVNIVGLPFYLDTSGTIFIAALGGYVPGIAVGFLTKFILAFFEPSEMYHCSVMLLIAIYAAYCARKGYYDKIQTTLLSILPLAFLAGSYDLLIDNFLSTANSSSVSRIFAWGFADNLLRELLDKGIMTLLAFALLKSTPLNIKKAFMRWGQMQAPLTEEMRLRIKAEDYLASSLRNKLLMIVMFGALFVALSIAVISYLLFKNTVINDRIKTADAIVTMVINEITPSRVDEYLELGRDATGYKATEERLYKIKNSNRAVEYLYVYKFAEDGCHVIFDLDSSSVEADKPGDVIEFDGTLLPYKNNLIAGKPIPPIISHDKYGYVLTLCKPLYDGQGKCLFYVAVDYSMTLLAEYTREFIIKLLALFIGCFIFVFVISFVFIENHIILPVNTMAYCARNFSYESEDARADNFARIRKLEIKTGDEIENLYQALLMTMKNVMDYFNNLKKTKMQVANMQVKVLAMDEIAYRDSLTGINNKAAYDRATGRLDERINNGNAEFCIIMVDVNFLKRVNDTYGHERGNEYLINACRLVCSVFGAEHVYRIGGDEFVVIVEGDRVSLCRYFVKQFKAEMDRKNANALLEPWEKVSAAVGVAFYDKAVDKTADEVFKRADKEMYANKLAMKAQRTD